MRSALRRNRTGCPGSDLSSNLHSRVPSCSGCSNRVEPRLHSAPKLGYRCDALASRGHACSRALRKVEKRWEYHSFPVPSVHRISYQSILPADIRPIDRSYPKLRYTFCHHLPQLCNQPPRGNQTESWLRRKALERRSLVQWESGLSFRTERTLGRRGVFARNEASSCRC